MTKKYWTVKITLVREGEYSDPMHKSEAKEMALQDFYDDMRHGCIDNLKIEIKEAK